MNFDPLSFVIGKHGDSGPVLDVVSYLMGQAVAAEGEIWQTITNVAIASFTTVSTMLRDLVIDVTPVQAGSGDPSPTNVRSISGWTGATIGNRNVIFTADIPSASGYYDGDGVYHTSVNTKHTTDYVPTCPGRNGKVEGIYVDQSRASIQRIYFYDAHKNFISRSDFPTGGTQFDDDWTLEFVTPINCAFLRFQFSVDAYSAHYSTLAFNYFATEISWQSEAGTVYGGTLTDNGDGTWTLTVSPYYASYVGEALVGPWVSSMDVYAPGTTPTTGAQVVDLGGAGTTYTITADSVQALIGQNNIFADCGNINTITFRTH